MYVSHGQKFKITHQNKTEFLLVKVTDFAFHETQ